ncbi:hypothetical protein, partial [Brevundimonas sp.]|uniref:hypothetical protein n=1 Tax=Brevundimonas sp. TaxID=1871086 RepID=UPI002D421FAE
EKPAPPVRAESAQCPEVNRVMDCEYVCALERGHAGGHDWHGVPAVPAPDEPEYELGKLRGALVLAQRSRELWRDRALAAGWSGDSRGSDPAACSELPSCSDGEHSASCEVSL